ncbi:MAG: SPOR domain-containing protein [Bacteroidota bacterium]
MIRTFLVVLVSFIFWSLPVAAQNIQITEEPAITRMMEAFVNQNNEQQSLSGYRIQILATPDRQRVESVKQGFRYRYPNIPVDWVHSKPYYKLRAGAFSTRLEALRLLHILKRDYPRAYLAADRAIRAEELIGTY